MFDKLKSFISFKKESNSLESLKNLQDLKNFKEAKDFEQFIGNLNVYKS